MQCTAPEYVCRNPVVSNLNVPFRTLFSSFIFLKLMFNFLIFLHRCTLIEPGPVTTQFGNNMLSQTEKAADEKSTQLRLKYEKAYLPIRCVPGTTEWFQPADEVAEIILAAILAENPDFRYQTTEIFKAEAKKKFTDPTGFSNVEKIKKRFFKE